MAIVFPDGTREFPINPLPQGKKSDRVYFSRNVIDLRHSLLVPTVGELISLLGFTQLTQNVIDPLAELHHPSEDNAIDLGRRPGRDKS
jgi:hypothetical protein